MPPEITATYFIEAVLPWVLLLVFALGLSCGTSAERSRWTEVVLAACPKDRFWRFEWVRDYAIRVSGAQWRTD